MRTLVDKNDGASRTPQDPPERTRKISTSLMLGFSLSQGSWWFSLTQESWSHDLLQRPSRTDQSRSRPRRCRRSRRLRESCSRFKLLRQGLGEEVGALLVWVERSFRRRNSFCHVTYYVARHRGMNSSMMQTTATVWQVSLHQIGY
jgi:hypothetical protein